MTVAHADDSSAPRDAHQRGTPSQRAALWARLLLVAVVVLIFGQACRYDFVNLDDQAVVLKNPLMNPPTLRSLKLWWTRPNIRMYEPLTATARGGIALLARMGNESNNGIALNPWLFHASNILLHIGATLLAYQVLLHLKIRPWPACGGAMLFALHPIQVEPVAWITSFKDLLYGFLGLLAIWRLLVSESACNVQQQTNDFVPGGARALWNYVFATLFFGLAILSKPTAVVLPLMTLPLLWLQCGHISRASRKRIAFWFLLAVPFIVIAKFAQPASYAPQVAVWERLFVAGDALAFYLLKILVPKTLMVYYGRNPAYIVEFGFIWWTWLLPTALCGYLWLNRRRWPAVFAGVCIFVAGLLPVLGFVRFDFQAYSTVADRYVYLSMFGVALIAAWTLEQLPRKYAQLSILLLLLLAARSLKQLPTWHNSLTLFAHVLENDPHIAVAYTGIANELESRGDYQGAVQYARSAIKTDAYHCDAYSTLAESLDALGQTDEAIGAFRDGFAVDLRTGASINNYATALIRRGKAEHALVFARLSVELVPRAVTHGNLGAALAATKDWQGARRELETAVSLEPTDYNTRCNLGSVLLQLGNRDDAIANYRAAEAIDPALPTAPKMLARLNLTTNKSDTTRP